MFAFVTYTLKAALLSAAFYTFWRLLLSKETFHRLNRIVLVMAPVVSMLLPLCVITIHKTEYVLPTTEGNFPLEMASKMAPGGAPLWKSIVCAIYAAGVAAVLLKTVISVIKLRKIIRDGEKTVLDDGSILVTTGKDVPPFSWMRYIILSKADSMAGNPEVLRHEQAHIRLHHSLDILLVDILSAFQWFNPMIWMLRGDLRGIHEYEADTAVLEGGIDATQYQLFLIRKAAADHGYTVANSFQSGTLKSRIAMMVREPSAGKAALKLLYIIPIGCLSLAATARTVVGYEVQSPAGMEAISPAAVPFQLVADKPTFGGGDANAFSRWVNSHLVYPEEAKDQNIQGRVTMSFTITENGDLTGVKVLRGAHPLLDAEALRVISMSPKWTPGRQDGENVPVTFTFPVIFQLK